MYVCICNAFTESQVEKLLDTTGARSPSQVYRGLHCKPQCGKCSVDIRRMIDEHRHGKPGSLPPLPDASENQPSAPAPSRLPRL